MKDFRKANNPKGLVVLFSLIMVGISIIAIQGFWETRRLDRSGVYVIGVVTRVSMSKSGSRIRGCFDYGKQRKCFSVTPDYSFESRVGKRFFVKVLPSDINVLRVIEDVKVPECYDNDESLRIVWKDIPVSCSDSSLILK